MQKIAIEEHFLLPELDDYFQMLARDVSSGSFDRCCRSSGTLTVVGWRIWKGWASTDQFCRASITAASSWIRIRTERSRWHAG
jgi:hypothetical protein